MRALRLTFALCVTASACSLPAQTVRAGYRHHGSYQLPDPKATPGATDRRAVADRSGTPHRVNGIEWNICAKDFRTKPIRALAGNFPQLKRQACAEYGVSPCDRSVEGDHLVSLEIGGCPSCIANIWPEKMSEARVKDHQVEDQLPKLVCAGAMTLKQAQSCIRRDWVKCESTIEKLKQRLPAAAAATE